MRTPNGGMNSMEIVLSMTDSIRKYRRLLDDIGQHFKEV